MKTKTPLLGIFRNVTGANSLALSHFLFQSRKKRVASRPSSKMACLPSCSKKKFLTHQKSSRSTNPIWQQSPNPPHPGGFIISQHHITALSSRIRSYIPQTRLFTTSQPKAPRNNGELSKDRELSIQSLHLSSPRPDHFLHHPSYRPSHHCQ